MKEITKIQKWIAALMLAIVCMTVTGCGNDGAELLEYNAVGIRVRISAESKQPYYYWIDESYVRAWDDDAYVQAQSLYPDIVSRKYFPATMDGICQAIRSDEYNYLSQGRTDDDLKKYLETKYPNIVAIIKSNEYQYIACESSTRYMFFNRVSDVNYHYPY